nr:zinc finger, CCHC-type [Tanacetum cinerariifolium]
RDRVQHWVQHSTHKLFSNREDNNEAAFAVPIVEKIYAHESLTFNNKVAYEAEIWATKGLLDQVKGNVLGMEIVKDQSGNTLRVSHPGFTTGSWKLRSYDAAHNGFVDK